MRSISVSLPVANLEVSGAFFAAVGFTVQPAADAVRTACVVIDDNVHVLLVDREQFQDVINGDSTGAESAGQMLTSLSADSEQEVDDILARALAAGARPWPIVPGAGAYCGTFQDLDGHLWQISCPRAEPKPARESADPLADALRLALLAEPALPALTAPVPG